jgi:hypothetical protein
MKARITTNHSGNRIYNSHKTENMLPILGKQLPAPISLTAESWRKNRTKSSHMDSHYSTGMIKERAYRIAVSFSPRIVNRLEFGACSSRDHGCSDDPCRIRMIPKRRQSHISTIPTQYRYGHSCLPTTAPYHHC